MKVWVLFLYRIGAATAAGGHLALLLMAVQSGETGRAILAGIGLFVAFDAWLVFSRMSRLHDHREALLEAQRMLGEVRRVLERILEAGKKAAS